MFKNTIILVSDEVKFELTDPDTVLFTCDDGKKYYTTINEESKKTIYDCLGIKYRLSKDLYNIDVTNWQMLITNCENGESYNALTDNSLYVIDSADNILLSVIISDTGEINRDDIREKLDEIDEILEEADEYYANCVYKLKIETENNGVGIFEINTISSTYRMYSMRKYHDILIPMFGIEASIDADNLKSFLDSDIRYEINFLSAFKDNGSYMTDDEADKVFGEMKLSLREVLNVIKQSKIKINLNEDELVDDIEGIGFKDSKFLINYLNSFSMAYKSLGKLTDTRKSVKYSGIDFVDLERFVQYFYFSDISTNVTMKVINYIFDCIDKSDAVCIKEELKVEV